MTSVASLSSQSFDAFGVERVCGHRFSFAKRGENAMLCSGTKKGKYEAVLSFPEEADRLLLLRASHESELQSLEVRVGLAPFSRVTLVVCLGEHSSGKTMLSLTTTLAEGSHLSLIFFHFSGGESQVFLQNHVVGNGARAETKSLFAGNRRAKGELRIETLLSGQETFGKIFMGAVVTDEASIVLSGLPRIEAGARGAQNFLQQKALLLSENASVRNLPGLSVRHDIVQAGHKSSLLRLLPEDLFYTGTRGISLQNAQNLLQQSLLDELLVSIADEPLQQELRERSQNFWK